jgi:hypothetical protein
MKTMMLLPLVVGCAANAPSTSQSAADLRGDICPANTPSTLAPPVDNELAFVLAASGVQEYTCNGTAWVFVAPDAQLYNPHDCAQDEALGHHYAGPTWEWYEDGSTVVGAKVAAATVGMGSIPWLLLKGVSHGPDQGRMSDVTFVQRLVTDGGIAPATGCDAAHAGASANVPYTAKYFFYRAANANGGVRCGG